MSIMLSQLWITDQYLLNKQAELRYPQGNVFNHGLIVPLACG